MARIEIADPVTFIRNRGPAGARGAAGADAYAAAVAAGFVGSEAAWLESLRGPDGEDGTDGEDGAAGPSAYAVAVSQGYVGSVSDWLASLKGEKGDTGTAGGGGGGAADLSKAGHVLMDMPLLTNLRNNASGEVGTLGGGGALDLDPVQGLGLNGSQFVTFPNMVGPMVGLGGSMRWADLCLSFQAKFSSPNDGQKIAGLGAGDASLVAMLNAWTTGAPGDYPNYTRPQAFLRQRLTPDGQLGMVTTANAWHWYAFLFTNSGDSTAYSIVALFVDGVLQNAFKGPADSGSGSSSSGFISGRQSSGGTTPALVIGSVATNGSAPTLPGKGLMSGRIRNFRVLKAPGFFDTTGGSSGGAAPAAILAESARLGYSWPAV